MNALKTLLALSVCAVLAFSAHVALAAPAGGNVVAGKAQIDQSGNTTTINQSSNRSIINWRSFDIGAAESFIHNMPGPNSAGLHRVVGGGGASQIEGLLKSNGNIFLVNPAGIVIHNGARIETGGFVASTADIRNEDFMKGNYQFNKPGQAGASIINSGNINVRDSGFAALVAPHVRNDGVIAARLGKVALASAESFKLDVYGDDLISFTTPEKVVDKLYTMEGAPIGVDNRGTIKAEGGTVLMTAKQLDGVVSSVVNNSGLVSAASAEMVGGKIVFRGEGSVDVVNTGTVDASSGTSDGGSVRMTTDGKVTSSGTIAATGGNKGGSVTLTGKEVALTGKAKIDASGERGGGTVLVGGNAYGKGPEKNAQNTRVEKDVVIAADAVSSGNGGQVVVWSDGTTVFDGTISAKGGTDGDGGWVETSGKVLKVGDSARVYTSAPAGKFGEWLLDPVDFVIAASGGDITGATLSANLDSNNVIIQSSQGQGGTNGDIFVNDAVSWSSNSLLTLSAYRDVNINANINATGNTAGLNIAPGTMGTYRLSYGAKISLSGANPSLSIFGRSFTVINSLAALQNMNLNTAGYYALGSDIDASATSGWNGGAGFMPIGGPTGPQFSGVFDGLGHTISALTINRPATTYVGLFGSTASGSVISNIGLVGANIIGQSWVGGLVGANGSTIFNSYSSGTVSGTAPVGGLVGENWGSISNSYSVAAVTGNSSVGGFVGRNVNNIANSYSTGAVVGNSAVGGFAGSNDSGTISNSYSTGAVTGTGRSGFVGGNNFGGVINCYWDTQTSGLTTSTGGGIGLTTAQMMAKASFNGWDFSSIWSIAEGQAYPQLKGAGSLGSIAINEGTGGNTDGVTTTIPAHGLTGSMLDQLDKAHKRLVFIAPGNGSNIEYSTEKAAINAYYNENIETFRSAALDVLYEYNILYSKNFELLKNALIAQCLEHVLDEVLDAIIKGKIDKLDIIAGVLMNQEIYQIIGVWLTINALISESYSYLMEFANVLNDNTLSSIGKNLLGIITIFPNAVGIYNNIQFCEFLIKFNENWFLSPIGNEQAMTSLVQNLSTAQGILAGANAMYNTAFELYHKTPGEFLYDAMIKTYVDGLKDGLKDATNLSNIASFKVADKIFSVTKDIAETSNNKNILIYNAVNAAKRVDDTFMSWQQNFHSYIESFAI